MQSRSRHLIVAVLPIAVVLAALTALPSLLDTNDASAAFLDHPSVVPEQAATGYPIIRGARSSGADSSLVWDSDQVGRTIVAGGNFREIELIDGTTITQPIFAAYSIDTGEMVCQQAFTFNKEIRSVAPGPRPTQVYVGGKFTKVTGSDGVERTRNKLALLNLDTCTVDTTFVATGANGKVTAIELFGNRLFVGGDFTAIGGQPVETIAELDAQTAEVNPAFSFTTVDEYWGRVMDIDVNPQGTRLVFGGRFGRILGNGRDIDAPTAKINIEDPQNPILTAHESTGYVNIRSYLGDLDVSHDASKVGLAFGRGTAGDYTYLTDVSGESRVSYVWRQYQGDSAYAVGVSNNALYVGGHFCTMPRGPGPTERMSPKYGNDSCTQAGRGVWRSQIAALDINDGTPLAWNPGSDAWVGHRHITITTRGMLTGFDANNSGGEKTGSLAFFDFGPQVEDFTPPSAASISTPTPGESIDNPTRIAGSATDNIGVNHFIVTIRDADGLYVQANGEVRRAPYDFFVLADDGSFELETINPPGSYTATVVAYDASGNPAAPAERSFVQTGLENVDPVGTPDQQRLRFGTETRAVVTGTATDNASVASVTARVTNSAGQFLRPDRTLTNTPVDYPVDIIKFALGRKELRWQVDMGGILPQDDYTVVVTITDASGNTDTVTIDFVVDDSPPGTLVEAVVAQSGGSFRDDGNYTLGYTFRLDEPRLLSELAIRDANGNGALDNNQDARMAVWRRSDRSELARVTIAPNTSVDGGWFWASLNAPVQLQAGVDYVIGFERFSDGEGYSNANGTTTTIDGVTINRSAYATGGLRYPDVQVGRSTGYGQPNMRFLDPVEVIPQPTLTGPMSVMLNDDPIVVTGGATDNLEVAELDLTITNAAGLYLQDNGSLSATPNTLPAVLENLNTESATLVYEAGLLPDGTYTAELTATDLIGNENSTTRTFSVGQIAIIDDGPAIVEQSGGSLRSGTDSGGRALGYAFILDEDKSVLRLGIRDADGDGQNDNDDPARVAIWRRSDRVMVASATVPADATVEDGWFYADADAPVELIAGVEYVIAFERESNGEGFRSTNTTLQTADDLTVTRAVYSSGGFVYPTNQANSSSGYGAPNIDFGIVRSGLPTITIDTPAGTYLDEEKVPVSGFVADNGIVSAVAVQVTNQDGLYRQDDGSFSAAQNDLPVSVFGLGTASSEIFYNFGRMPIGTYEMTVTGVDAVGNESTRSRSFEVTDQVAVPTPMLLGVNGGTVRGGTDTAGRTLGYAFTLDEDRTATRLGIFDANGNGINDNGSAAPVGIWRGNDQTLLASVSVDPNAPLEDGWFYGDIGAAVTLEAGVEYYIAFLRESNGEPFRDRRNVTVPTIDGVDITRWAYGGSNGFLFPNVNSGSNAGFGMPNVVFEVREGAGAVPEVAIATPGSRVFVENSVVLSGVATDNVSVETVVGRLTNALGDYRQGDGSFAPTPASLPLQVVGLGTATADWSLNIGTLAIGEYTLVIEATDVLGRTGTASLTFEVGDKVSKDVLATIGNFNTNTRDRTVGYTFTVDTATDLTAVAMFDSNGNGTVDNDQAAPIGVWRKSDQTLLASAEVPIDAIAVDDFFWVDLPAALSLQPNVEYVVAVQHWNNQERYAQDADVTIADDAAGFTIVNRARRTSAEFGYPSDQSSTTIAALDYVVNLRLSVAGTPAGNAPPSIADIADKQNLSGTSITPFQVVAIDPEGEAIQFSSTGLPPGVGISAGGVLQGTPTTAGTFVPTVTVTDVGGLTDSTSFTWVITDPEDPPVGPQTCIATANADGSLTLAWTAIDGENSYVVRKLDNTKWYASVGNVLTSVIPAADGGDGPFWIRSSMGGVRTDTPCEGDAPEPPGPDPDVQTCQATTNADGSVTLVWTAIEGEDTYILRKLDNTKWYASVGNSLTFAVPVADAGEGPFWVRSRMGDTTTNTACAG